jgi:high affinity Mn2+ porin
MGIGIPLHREERLQAASGFSSAAYDLYPSSKARNSPTFGAQIGYNWQAGNIVWALESDFNFLNTLPGSQGAYIIPPEDIYGGPAFYVLNRKTGATYFSTVRARIGYSVGDALLYLTGGIANGGSRGQANLTIYNNDIVQSFDTGFYTTPGVLSDTPWSWSSRMKYAFGAGIERRLSHEWSAKLEYLLLNQSLNTQLFDDGNGNDFISRVRNENHILRFGMNYHFGEENELKDGTNPLAGNGKHDDDEPEQYSFHMLSTSVAQGYPKFKAKYDGDKSLPADGQVRGLTQNDLFFGLRLWKGAVFYVDPEVIEGYGIGNSQGSGSFFNSLAQKLGRSAPYLRFQRFFGRQIIGLNGGAADQTENVEGERSELLESIQNQVSGKVDKDRITITVGRFAVGDVFDDNIYAHDPTIGFLNFTFNSLGSFDYASDAWGYANGGAAEWKQDWWTVRAGMYQLTKVPNGYDVEQSLFKQYQATVEVEARYEILGQPGEIKLLTYGDKGNFAKFNDVINYAFANNIFPPDVNQVRSRHFKPGGGINIEQQLAENIGFFARASLTDGRYQTTGFTDMDKQFTAGLVFQGNIWDRTDDTVG